MIWPGGRCSPAAMWSWRSPRTCLASPRTARALGRPGAGRPRSGAPGRRGRRPGKGAFAGLRPRPGRPPSPRAWPTSWAAATPPPWPLGAVEAAIAETEQRARGQALRGATGGGRRYLHFGARGRAGRGGGRGRQDHDAAGRGRGLRGRRLPSDRHAPRPARRPATSARRPGSASPARWPASSGGSTMASSCSPKSPSSSWTKWG